MVKGGRVGQGRAMFPEYLLAQGLSEKTVRIYTTHVYRARDWVHGQGSHLVSAPPSLLVAYADTLPHSASTRRQLRSALRYWWQFHDVPGYPKAIRVPRKDRGMCRALPADQARALAKTAFGWWPEGTAVLLGLYLALRSAEIAAARWDGFDAGFGWYRLVGKRDQTATLPVHPLLADELRSQHHAYLWLFPGQGDRPHIHPGTVWLWVNRVAESAGLEHRIDVHQLRHTALATAHDGTGDLRATMTFARHARPETTALYTRTTVVRLQAVVDALDYL